MSKLIEFPKRWQPENPSMLQLYSLATPNGQKVSITLEELDLSYESHVINIMEGDQFDEDYLKLSPNGKIPAIIDPDGIDGRPFASMESGAILLYLAEKHQRLLPSDVLARQQVLQWLFFQVGHIGPMFGQFGHFNNYAGDRCDHPYPLERYKTEVERLLGVLEAQLSRHEYLAGDEYTIADISVWPWVQCLEEYYGAAEDLKLASYPSLAAWRSKVAARPAVQKGVQVCNPWSKQ